MDKKSDHDIKRRLRLTYQVVWNLFLFFIFAGIISLFFIGGAGAGYFASLIKDEPIRSYASMKKDIYNYEETSKLYFAGDKYIGDISSDIYREEVPLKEVSEVLTQAVVAAEDELFYEHKGIVPKAIIRAVIQEATNANIKTGGSTLTQQLIKNQILTNEVSFERKAKEILLALRLEKFFKKDEILEAYLNVIPYGRDSSGRNIAGVQTAAQGIFGINAKELNLAQAAYLAGLPQSPSKYTPFLNTGEIKEEDELNLGLNRMKYVLNRMHQAGYINEKEYKEAIDYDIVADFTEKKSSPVESYPYLTFELEKRAKDILLEKLIEKDGYTLEDLENNEELKEQYQILADRDLRMNGYHIHSTIDKKIYDAFQKVAKDYQYYGPDRKFTEKDPNSGEVIEKVEKIQAGGVLIENGTGRIISFLGGREYSEDNQLNYATNAKRPTGSTIKPILDYAPAMEKGAVQPGSVIADIPWTYHGWSPKNYGGGHYGLVTAREALAKSYNIPAAKTYTKILHENPAEEYLVKMGVTSLTEVDKTIPALSLGAMQHGMTVEENVNAFATLGNNGKFADGYMIEKITTSDGEVIYEHKTDEVDVFSPQTTYLTIDMMRDVIKYGTASYLNSQLKHGGVDWAGKTGTTDDYEDAWFIGTNPNVTFGTWIGYKTPHSIQCTNCSLSYSHRNLKLWASLINAAADINPDLVTPKEHFKRPEGIVSRSFCAISGLLPSDLCQKAGLVKSDIFNSKYVPNKVDDSLIGSAAGALVKVNGKEVIAGPDTPKEFTYGTGVGLAFNPEFLKRNGYDRLGDLSILFPRTNRELWEKIGFSGVDADNGVKDTGQNPAPPGSLSSSSSQLSWSKSGSVNVVGYRIFYASEPGGSFSLIGHTTDHSYSLNKGSGVYHVKAVDYFGRESAPSQEIEVGEIEDTEPDDEEQDKDKDKDKDKQEPEQPKEPEEKPKENDEKPKDNEPNPDNNGDNGNGNGSNNGNGNKPTEPNNDED